MLICYECHYFKKVLIFWKGRRRKYLKSKSHEDENLSLKKSTFHIEEFSY